MSPSIHLPPSYIKSKPASDWNQDDLTTLDVHVKKLSVQEFFGCSVEQLPDPKFLYSYLEETLTACVPPMSDGPLPEDIVVKNFHELIERVSRSYTEVNVDLLVYLLLQYIGYQKLAPGVVTSLYIQEEFKFTMSNTVTIAKVDLAVMDDYRKLLCLYVENKRLVYSQTDKASLAWPHPQIVAEALAAASHNMDGLKDTFYDVVIPAFSFIGTWPCFYLIPITAAFAAAVARGEIPPHPTKVFYCQAPLTYEFYGMSLRDQRILILKMFEAFKRFIPTNFAQLCRFSGLEGDVIPRPLNPAYETNAWDWVRRFLWECEEYYRRRGINKFDYCGTATNYFMNTTARAPTLVPTDNVVNSTSSPPSIPRGSRWGVYTIDKPDSNSGGLLMSKTHGIITVNNNNNENGSGTIEGVNNLEFGLLNSLNGVAAAEGRISFAYVDTRVTCEVYSGTESSASSTSSFAKGKGKEVEVEGASVDAAPSFFPPTPIAPKKNALLDAAYHSAEAVPRGEFSVAVLQRCMFHLFIHHIYSPVLTSFTNLLENRTGPEAAAREERKGVKRRLRRRLRDEGDERECDKGRCDEDRLRKDMSSVVLPLPIVLPVAAAASSMSPDDKEDWETRIVTDGSFGMPTFASADVLPVSVTAMEVVSMELAAVATNELAVVA